MNKIHGFKLRNWIVLVLLSFPMLSLACNFDGLYTKIPTSLADTGLIVSLSTYRAVKQSQISAPKMLFGDQGFRRVNWWLREFAKDLNSPQLAQDFVLYIPGPELPAVFNLVDGKWQVTTHILELPESLTIYVVSEEGLAALSANKIDVGQAFKLGILKAHNVQGAKLAHSSKDKPSLLRQSI